MNITALADTRAQCLARLEELAGWGDSKDAEERAAYYAAQTAYQSAENAYQRELSLLTNEEIVALGIKP